MPRRSAYQGPRPLPGHARPRLHYPQPRVEVEPAIEPEPVPPPEPWPSIQFGDLTILLPPEKGPNDPCPMNSIARPPRTAPPPAVWIRGKDRTEKDA